MFKITELGYKIIKTWVISMSALLVVGSIVTYPLLDVYIGETGPRILTAIIVSAQVVAVVCVPLLLLIWLIASLLNKKQ